jgi:hypothetical protein
MGEGSAKNIPYGFHMEDTGECKDLAMYSHPPANDTVKL